MPVALKSMIETYEAVSEDTSRRSCKRISRAEGGCNNGYISHFSLIYTYREQIMEASTVRHSRLPVG